MSVYVIVTREGPVRDAAALARYSEMNRASAGKFTALKPLAIYGATETWEGAAPDGVLLLEFPTVEAARAWYNSPEYQAAIPFRQRAADYRILMVQGL